MNLTLLFLIGFLFAGFYCPLYFIFVYFSTAFSSENSSGALADIRDLYLLVPALCKIVCITKFFLGNFKELWYLYHGNIISVLEFKILFKVIMLLSWAFTYIIMKVFFKLIIYLIAFDTIQNG